MKKQKYSLLLNIVTICLSICAIAIGVYSAKTASLGISGSIDFTAHNCEVRVLGKVEGANEKVTPYQESTGVGKVVSVTAETWEVGDITFDSSNCAEDEIATPITFTFEMSNMSEFAVLATLNFPTAWEDVLSISDTYSEDANSFDFAVVLPQGASGTEGDTVTMTVTFKPVSAVSFDNALSLSDLKLNFEKVKSYSQSDAKVVDISAIVGAEAGTYTYNQYEYDDKFYICELSFFNSMNVVSSDDVEKYVGIYPKDTSVSGDLTYPSVAICLTTASDTQSKIYRTAPIINFEASINAQVSGSTISFPNITSVKLSNGINKILQSAFMGFTNMTDITIPSSVTSIGDSAFASCDNLENITIGCDIDKMFQSKTSIKNVTLLEGVTSIGEDAFNGCSNLTNISIPNTVTSIGEDAFNRCSNLTSINIPSSVTSLGERAFCNCSNLSSVTIAENSQLTTIPTKAFTDCSSLTEITIPSSVTSMGEWVFCECNNLISVSFGENSQLTAIPERAFQDCSNLTSITIPNKVTSIGMYAFYGCSKLTSITIPSGVTSIDSFAFYNCSGLVKVVNKSTLGIVAGSTNNGYVAYYAEQVITDDSDS